MAHIPPVPEDQAGDELRPLYEMAGQALGYVPTLMQVLGNRPDLLRQLLAGYGELQSPAGLPQPLKEKLALVVSAANSNSYCIRAHLELLGKLGVDTAIGKQLVNDHRSADVPDKEKALFDFAKKLTVAPFEIKGEDVEALREHGWEDGEILEAVHVTSYFNHINRLAAGLGVIPEDVF